MKTLNWDRIDEDVKVESGTHSVTIILSDSLARALVKLLDKSADSRMKELCQQIIEAME